MKRLIIYFKTILNLGLLNVLYVAWYRFTLKTGIRQILFPRKKIIVRSDFYRPCAVRSDYPAGWKEPLIDDADKILTGTIRYYGYHWKKTGNPPDWFLNPFNGKRYPDENKHWTKLPDFHPEVGDIKNVWEASRFEWVVTLARAYAVTGYDKYLDTLNRWLKDWAEKNPLNTGPNWKCGQEASIRIINLINAAFILDQWRNPSESLAEIILLHLKRVKRNMIYAKGQNNNHIISEAAGIFIGGSWLNLIQNNKYLKFKLYSYKGRRYLEKFVKKLFFKDGGFSMYSVNYHRMVLDILSFVEFWRRNTFQEKFSSGFYEITNSAIKWLWEITDGISGNTPNIGSNDGALVNNLHSCTYRDFRPSLQLSSIIFLGKRLFTNGSFNEPLIWVGLNNISSKAIFEKRNNSIKDSGFIILHGSNSWALIRFPYFKFRPSHNDTLHFDLWYKGESIICDAGTFSYNPLFNFENIDLRSIHFHNSVSFDGAEPMPLLDRFLIGGWIKSGIIESKTIVNNGYKVWCGSYKDYAGNKHTRIIRFIYDDWIIEDTLEGKFKYALIGLNLNTSICKLTKSVIHTSFGIITAPEYSKILLKEIAVSDYYMEKHTVKRVEFYIDREGVFVTKISLNTFNRLN